MATTSITCISDTHGQHRALSKKHEMSGDFLFFAGDYQLNGFDDGCDFVDWLSSLNFTYKIAIAGNHDCNYAIASDYAKRYSDKGVHFLMNESIEVEGLKIWGSPYSRKFMDWSFMKEEWELEHIWKEIPNDTNIVLTHCPSFGILDNIGEERIGSITLRLKLDKMTNMNYHICGHVHERYGAMRNEQSPYRNWHINASVLTDKYKLKNKPIRRQI